MHILTKSKITFLIIFINFIFTVWLFSEGFTWQGISLLWVLLIFAALSFFYFRNKVLGSVTNLNSNQKYNYSMYLRKCFFSSIEAKANIITRQSSFMIICRAVICITIIVLCLYNLIFPTFSYFPSAVFNKLMYICIITFSVMYLVAGLRFCAFPAFVTFCLMMFAYYLYKFSFAINVLYFIRSIIFYVNISISFIIGCKILSYFIKKNYFYSDLQSFDHFGNYQITDLYLKEFTQIESYETLLKFKIPLGNISEDEILNFGYHILDFCRMFKIIFAGMVVNKNTNSVEIFCYSEIDQEDSVSEFIYTINKYTQKIFSLNCVCKKMNDSKWLVYKNILYPSNSELCSIKSRNHIEDLFIDGKTFDSDYNLSFYIYFKEKRHLVEFEKILEYHGFELMNASFTGVSSKKILGYPYCGEYMTTTYISVRRLECLNKTILEESEKFGCYYIGDWDVNE